MIVGILFIEGILATYTDWPDWARPGEDCLPFDGSRVPDCKMFVDPILKQPYYHPHSSNCSRFWECGPELETCLFECASCGKPDPMCNDQWALTFDESYQFPYGPVCDWPSNIDCTNKPGTCECESWQTDCVNGKCMPQCIEDAHCPDGYECSDCGWCEATFECNNDSDCRSDMCDPPNNPHTTCEYCDPNLHTCQPGCPADDLCPSKYPICGHGGGIHVCGCNTDEDCGQDMICNSNEHKCYPKPINGCENDNANCPSEMCDEPNWPYTTCTYCDGQNCRYGCPDNSKCPSNKPICGANGQPHRCGCNTDADCPGDLPKCDTNENECYKPECSTDADCANGICDTQNAPNYLECEYCEGENCVPGCIDETHCPDGFYCSAAHICTVKAGKTILKNIKIYTTSCDGCTEEGLRLQLNGDQQVVNKVHCETNTLNTPADNEFADGAETVFDQKVTVGVFEENGGCLNAPLGGVLTDSTYIWSGTGTWKGDKVCVEWEGEDRFASTCRFEAAGKITDCGQESGVECP